jgi:hypothetical protein
MVLIGNQHRLFITNGKLGTSTLLHYYGNLGEKYYKPSIDLPEDFRRDLYQDQGHVPERYFIIREPIERFYSGFVQVILHEYPINIVNLRAAVGTETFNTTIVPMLTTEDFWRTAIETYFANNTWIAGGYIDATDQYHFGKWLTFARQSKESGTDEHIVHIRNLNKLLLEIGHFPVHKNKGNESLRISSEHQYNIYDIVHKIMVDSGVYSLLLDYFKDEIENYRILMQYEKYDSN